MCNIRALSAKAILQPQSVNLTVTSKFAHVEQYEHSRGRIKPQAFTVVLKNTLVSMCVYLAGRSDDPHLDR